MNSNPSENSQANVQQLLSALAEHQRLQTEFARSQQQVSQKIENALLALTDAICTMPAHFEVGESPSAATTVKYKCPSDFLVNENPRSSGVQQDTKKAAPAVDVTGSQMNASNAAFASPALAKPKSLYQTSADVAAESKAAASAIQKKLEVESARPKDVSQAPVRSLYRTFAEEQTLAHEQSQPHQQPAEADENSAEPAVSNASNPKTSLQEFEAPKPVAVEAALDDIEVQQLAESTLKRIEALLPTVDPLEGQLDIASQLVEAACDVPSEFEPKLVPVRKAAVRNPLPVRPPRAVEVDEDEQETVMDSAEMESSDERSLMEQIHRFTETLSESKTFWKQVTIPKYEAEGDPAAKSLDPTASIAAQYENTSRSPYSH